MASLLKERSDSRRRQRHGKRARRRRTGGSVRILIRTPIMPRPEICKGRVGCVLDADAEAVAGDGGLEERRVEGGVEEADASARFQSDHAVQGAAVEAGETSVRNLKDGSGHSCSRLYPLSHDQCSTQGVRAVLALGRNLIFCFTLTPSTAKFLLLLPPSLRRQIGAYVRADIEESWALMQLLISPLF